MMGKTVVDYGLYRKPCFLMVAARSPAENFMALSAGQAVSVVAALITNIWLARILGPSGLGILGFGSAVVAYLVLGTACGSEVWGARLIASKRYSVATVTSRVSGMRIWTFVGAMGVFYMALPFLAADETAQTIVMVQAGAVCAVPITLDYFYQGIQRQATNAARQAFQSVLILVLSLYLVRSSQDVLSAAVAQSLGVMVPALIIFFITYGRFPIVVPNLSFRAMTKTFRRVAPFTVSAFVNTLFFTVDIVMLGILSNSYETGLYVAGSRLMLFSLMPAGMIFAVSFPKLVSAPVEKRRRIFGIYAIAISLVGVSGCAVAIATAPTLISTIYGDAFLPAVSIFIVQMATVIMVHGRMAPGGGMSSWGLQKEHARSTSIAALINVALNVFLIRKFGAAGAAYATLISQIAIYAMFTYWLRRRTGIGVLGKQLAALLCGALACGAVYGLATQVTGVLLIVGGTVLSVLVTLLMARLMGLYRWSEIQEMLRPPATS